MAESKHQQGGNGSDEETGSRRGGRGGGYQSQSLVEAGRRLSGDAQTMVTHAQEASTEFQTYVSQRVRERPMATLAAAAGVGYLLGGGLSSRLTLLAVGMATRFAMAVAAREMGNMLTEGAQQQGGGGMEPSPTHH